MKKTLNGLHDLRNNKNLCRGYIRREIYPKSSRSAEQHCTDTFPYPSVPNRSMHYRRNVIYGMIHICLSRGQLLFGSSFNASLAFSAHSV